MQSIRKIDTKFLREEFCGVHIVKSADGYSLVEAGSTLSVPPVVEFCKRENIAPEEVKRILITHVHLDHSGGAGVMLAAFPQARVFTHSAGVAHIINPHAKLVQGAVEVYGQDVFDKDYPGILGADPARVVGCQDGQQIGDFIFYDAHGHAFHHGMFYFVPEKVLFTGDGLGFGFKAMNMCPLLCTSPTQYDSAAWRQTLERVRGLDVAVFQPTHFDAFPGTDKERILESCSRQLDEYDRLIATVDDKEALKAAFKDVIAAELKRFHCADAQKAYELIFGDINVDGLWYRIQRRLAKQKK